MKILINTTNLKFGGAVQVALSFIYECKIHEENEYHVILGPGVSAVLNCNDFPENFRFREKSFGVIGLAKLRHIQREMSAIEAEVKPDCVITTSGPPFWRSCSPHLVGFNRPLFIYPESPYIQNLTPILKAKLALQRSVHCWYFNRDADALIVQTDDVNDRVRKLLKTDRVYTVTNTQNSWFDHPMDYPPKLPAREPELFRFLTLTSYYPHKNLELIPELINLLPEDLSERVEFVLTLREAEYREYIGHEIPSQVVLTGPVPPPECPSLYKECDAMFMPTLAECFSASYPEAMKMDKPIITTDLGFARSICNHAALYYKPSDAQSAVTQIQSLINSPDLRETLCRNGRDRLSAFDDSAMRAEKILGICKQLVLDHA